MICLLIIFFQKKKCQNISIFYFKKTGFIGTFFLTITGQIIISFLKKKIVQKINEKMDNYDF